MSQTFSYLFYAKRRNASIVGPIQIYLRITVAGKRAEMSIGREVHSDNWDQDGRRITTKDKRYTKEQVNEFKSYLDAIQTKLYDAHQALLREGKPITAEALKNQYNGVSDKPRMLMPIFQKHNDEMEALIPSEYAAGTLQRYTITYSHIQDFLKTRRRVADIDIRDIDHELITDFDFYLRSVRACANNTAVKYVSYFKKIIGICLSNGWLDKDPFVKFKPKLREVERVFLTEEELQAVEEKQFASIRVQQVKDIFLFSCYTGLAYVDVQKLSAANISIGIDGEKWLFVNRTKTDTPSPVPLLPPALAILEQYSNHPQCLNRRKLLPVLSNQKMNAYLKEIADLCGISKELTFHTARHTFATTVTLNNDVPIETVSKMMGHKSLKITQHYAKLLHKKIGRDMDKLKQKYHGPLKLVKSS
ncbi:MAG: site-specific integrase [Bacteroidetes bacterium]|nr:site-specific integrase [Bacteroidota bacterium]